MTGTFEYEKGDKRSLPDFNVFFRHQATYPFYSDCIWYLTQMRRWGQISEPKENEWYFETARSIYLPEVWLKAANALVDDGLADVVVVAVVALEADPSRETLTRDLPEGIDVTVACGGADTEGEPMPEAAPAMTAAAPSVTLTVPADGSTVDGPNVMVHLESTVPIVVAVSR